MVNKELIPVNCVKKSRSYSKLQHYGLSIHFYTLKDTYLVAWRFASIRDYSPPLLCFIFYE